MNLMPQLRGAVHPVDKIGRLVQFLAMPWQARQIR
jgi:cobalamin biosynthesis protein CobD/CbiB